MKTAGYESDQNKIFLIPDVKGVTVNGLSATTADKSQWDRSPQSLTFSHDAKTLYFPAEDEGYGRLFALSLDSTQPAGLTKLSQHGYVSSKY